MIYNTLGKTGLEVSRLGFGTMRLPTFGSNAEINEEEASKMLEYGIENGINLIVLENYGENAPLAEGEKGFNKRNELFNLFQNKQITLAEIANELCKEYGVNPFSASLSDMANKYRALERLDNIWDDFLNKIEQKNSKR